MLASRHKPFLSRPFIIYGFFIQRAQTLNRCRCNANLYMRTFIHALEVALTKQHCGLDLNLKIPWRRL